MISENSVLDRDFRMVAKRSGFDNVSMGRIPTDFPILKARLKSMYAKAALLQVITGWMLYIYVHLAVVLVLQFIAGFVNTSMFNRFQTLMADLFPSKSASITAKNNLVRYLLGAVATVVIEPGIQCWFRLDIYNHWASLCSI